MSDGHLKTPLARSLPRAISKGATDLQQLQGKALPASVKAVVSSGVVRVKFEVQSDFTLPDIVVPVLGAQYVRLPIQAGCKGLVIPGDAYLGEMSGLGGGVASLTQPANLGALVFVPIAANGWSASDPDTLRLYGVTKAVMQASDGSDVAATLTATDATLAFDANNYVKVSGDGVDIKGTLTINGVPYLDHMHSGVQTGGSDTGPVA